jgi:hypothetical protein
MADKVYFAAKILPVTREVTLGIGGGSKRRVREMLDGLIGVTVMRVGPVIEKTENVDSNQTLIVSLAGPRQTRRITAFGEKNIKLFETLGLGDVIEAYGNPIYNQPDTTGPNGMSVEAVHVIEKADAEKAAAMSHAAGIIADDLHSDNPIDLD